MAQDFGDDAGERLERGIMRLLGELVRGAWRHHAENKRLAQQQKYYEQRLQQEGTAPETATVAANAMAQREQVCIPFGTQADAAYFAQVCRDNGTYVTALYDQSGKGYIEFAADDLARVQQSVPQFSEVMTQLNNEEIAQTLESAKPLTESQIGELKEITDLPDLPGRDATERDAQSRDEEPDLSSRENPLPNHTEHIAQEVAAARAKCSTFEELQTALAQRGIGTTVTKDGETHVSHDKGDFVLVKGVTYLPERGEGLMPGTYTALASAETVSSFKLRLGGYVREYKHGDTVVLAEGDPVCAVSCNVILR